MGWIEFALIWFFYPAFADEFEGREALERPEPSCKVAGVDKVAEMPPELIVVIVVTAFHRGVLDGSIHSLDLSIRPGMGDFREAMLNIVPATYAIEDVFEGVGILLAICELDAVIRQGCHPQDRVEPAGNGGYQVAQELGSVHLARLLQQANEGESARSINADKEVRLAPLGTNLGDIDVKAADGISLEPLLRGFVAGHIRQPTDPVRGTPCGAPRAVADIGAMKSASDVADSAAGPAARRIEAIVQRQQRMMPKSDDSRFIGFAENGRTLHAARGSVGPVLRTATLISSTDPRFRHFATVFGLRGGPAFSTSFQSE